MLKTIAIIACSSVPVEVFIKTHRKQPLSGCCLYISQMRFYSASFLRIL
jgi:hypothetical protein